MLQCWAGMPTDRPTFEALKDFLAETVPVIVRSLEPFEEQGKMQIEQGDTIIVIEGKSENFWWKGQNQRSFDIGLFPRKIVQDTQGKKIRDISKPLKNSFIHTGHGSSNQGRSWGRPEAIDDLYIRSPMQAQDISSPSQENEVTNEIRLQGRNSMRTKLTPPNIQTTIRQTQQFKYERLEDQAIDTRLQQVTETTATIVPRRPAPGCPAENTRRSTSDNMQSMQGYKSMPDLHRNYSHETESTNTLSKKEDSLIDLSPDEQFEGRLYANTSQEDGRNEMSLNTSIIDQDIPATADDNHRYQNNESYNNYGSNVTNDLNNESFSSLPAGETYHLPPDDVVDQYDQTPTEEENDPFDTSNIDIDSQGTLTRYNQGAAERLKSQSMTNVNESKPSIIAQLLASNDIDNTMSKPSTPPMLQVAATSTPEPLESNETVDSTRHRRALSAANSEPEFFPPLSSPFSPPAFNPYDVDLGSNEAIAGLDSPAPYNKKVSNKPKRQTEQNSSEAFSWLNEKIGDMKISKKPQEYNVFQFPNLENTGTSTAPAGSTLMPEELYATVNKICRNDKMQQMSQLSTNTALSQHAGLDNSAETLQPNTQNQERAKSHSPQQQQHQMIQQQLKQQQYNQQQQYLQQQKQNHHNMQQSQHLQQKMYQEQQFQQQQQQQQQQQIMMQQGNLAGQALVPFNNQYSQYNRMEKEMEMKNLEKLKQQKQERERKEWEERRRMEDERKRQEAERVKREEERLQREALRLREEQRQRIEEQRRQEEEARMRSSMMVGGSGGGARPRTQQHIKPQQSHQQQDVFHFTQFSTASTAGQTKETFSVDSNFIRDLEKSLGDNESKKVFFIDKRFSFVYLLCLRVDTINDS